MNKVCGNCKNYYYPLCKLNPQSVEKGTTDTCSYWGEKMLNETPVSSTDLPGTYKEFKGCCAQSARVCEPNN